MSIQKSKTLAKAVGDGSLEGRESWGNSWSFRLAALGSAIGLGAIVRFPFLTYRYGGAAFLIPYVLFLGVLGIPLLALEFALGTRFQQGPVGAMAKINPRMWTIGMWGCVTAFLVLITYNLIMAWSWIFLANTFQATLPWGTTIAEAKKFFAEEVQGQVPGSCSTNLECGLGAVQWKLALALAFQYLVVFLAIFKGTKLVGKIVWVTVTTPIVMVVVLLVYSLTLEGAGQGVYAYIGTVDTSHLLNGEAWVDAAGQIFYGLSLAVGCMVAYGSQQQQDKPVNFSVFFVSITNSVYSFVGGFAMFAVMGYLVNDMGVSFDDMSGNVGGFMLSFVSFPTAIALLPSGVSHFFAAFFFIFLLMLGLDSSMALTEACTITLRDHVPYFKERPAAAAGVTVLAAFLTGLMFCTQGGEAAMDIMDHFTSNYCLLLVGLFECLSVWIYEFGGSDDRKPLREQSWYDIVFSSRLEKEMEKLTGASMKYLPFVWSFHVKFIAPLIVFGLFVIMVMKDVTVRNYGGYPSWALLVFGWIMCVLVPMGMVFVGSFFPLRLHDNAIVYIDGPSSSQKDSTRRTRRDSYLSERRDTMFSEDGNDNEGPVIIV